METVKQHLEQHGVRPSVQRIAIMKYLMEHCTHPTVDTIYSDLLPELPTLSRTTVYNTLELFRQANAAKVLTIDKRNVRYDACVNPHAHFMCRECGRIFDMEIDDHLKAHLHDSEHFLIEQVELNSTGLCEECQAKMLADKN
ncbi:MAG: Fur family transcriptional regulator [Bacteroidales bacterium]|nr:Fur family transcriptional regulator [Bacteroidales bacterium]